MVHRTEAERPFVGSSSRLTIRPGACALAVFSVFSPFAPPKSMNGLLVILRSTLRTILASYLAAIAPHKNAYLASSLSLDTTHPGRYRSFSTQHGIAPRRARLVRRVHRVAVRLVTPVRRQHERVGADATRERGHLAERKLEIRQMGMGPLLRRRRRAKEGLSPARRRAPRATPTSPRDRTPSPPGTTRSSARRGRIGRPRREYYYSRRFLSSRGFRPGIGRPRRVSRKRVAIVQPGNLRERASARLGVREGAERAQVHVQRLAPDAIARDDALVREGVRRAPRARARARSKTVPIFSASPAESSSVVLRSIAARNACTSLNASTVSKSSFTRVYRGAASSTARTTAASLGHPGIASRRYRSPSAVEGPGGGPPAWRASPSSSYASETS